MHFFTFGKAQQGLNAAQESILANSTSKRQPDCSSASKRTVECFAGPVCLPVTMALLLQPCLHAEFGRCPARQQYLSQRTGHAWPCARLAATRGSESPNEEVLERLKRAEAEAAQLRKEIAAARVRVGALSCWGVVGRRWRLAPVPLPAPNTQQKERVSHTRLRRPLSLLLSKAPYRLGFIVALARLRVPS